MMESPVTGSAFGPVVGSLAGGSAALTAAAAALAATPPAPLVAVTRGRFVECIHSGHAVICDCKGVIAAWGDPNALILPRSSAKMIQALPLVESGAADAAGLGAKELALACASHNGAAIHTAPVARWLDRLGWEAADLRCGPQPPRDAAAKAALAQTGDPPGQIHNNCSGKHAGFLTLGWHLQTDAAYVDAAHPVQTAVRAAWEEVTQAISPGHAIDGCSAPNFAGKLHDFATAMARFAQPEYGFSGRRADAARRLVEAMRTHPELVAGEGRACTTLMRAAAGRAAVKTGAEGAFFAILPERGIGVALKIADGATRAAECVMATLLVRLGVVEASDPRVLTLIHQPQRNRRGILTGHVAPMPALFASGARL